MANDEPEDLSDKEEADSHIAHQMEEPAKAFEKDNNFKLDIKTLLAKKF
jgi:hypothetical protein